MKKWLKKIWNGAREWFLEAVSWDRLAARYDIDLSGAEPPGQGSDFAQANAAPSAPGMSPEENDVKGGTGGDAKDRAGDSSSPTPTPTPTASDGVDFALLDWRWGGFNGARAALADCRIAALKVTRNGLSYSWESGGCEDMGASGPHDAACLACLFCHVRDQWLGGKFDWISTDRRTRDFENIESGYGGWEPEAFRDADAYAFVIVSKDGRRRTNVIVQMGRN